MQQAARERLVKFGIRPSVQRIAIMKYLLSHRTHPTVDEIYTALAPEIPTLSKTTVYNTLHLLYEHGAILLISIDPANTHFDGYTHPHAHFLCTKCTKVYDVEIDDTAFVDRNKPSMAAEITDSELYYVGVCRECGNQQTEEKQ